MKKTYIQFITPEDNIEDIAFDIECYIMFNNLEKKYRGERIGNLSRDIMSLLDTRIDEGIHRHYSLFDERISRREIEALL